MLSLTIHHNIHLSKQQRYDLHDGKEIKTIGYSIPVWFIDKTTSEPAKEVFCVYLLKNPKQEIPIQILDNGYEITIPYREGTKLNISDEEWRSLKAQNPEKLEQLYKQLLPEVSSKNLLDIADGGSGGYLSYREHNKVMKNDQPLNIMHYVCIHTIESLNESLAF